jgi:thiamine biosynthesis lipoprotein
VIGAPPGRTNWTVQLEDPDKQCRRIKVPLRDAALSTSGNYENFFEINGVRFSHILNPHTGYPVQGIAACTVIAPTCMESDAMATACFVYGPEKSMTRFGEQFPMRFTLSPVNSDQELRMARQTVPFPASN